VARGVEERDRPAVAVTNQKRLLNRQPGEQLWQDIPGFAMQVLGSRDESSRVERP
jgi:hypothetical protein